MAGGENEPLVWHPVWRVAVGENTYLWLCEGTCTCFRAAVQLSYDVYFHKASKQTLRKPSVYPFMTILNYSHGKRIFTEIPMAWESSFECKTWSWNIFATKQCINDAFYSHFLNLSPQFHRGVRSQGFTGLPSPKQRPEMGLDPSSHSSDWVFFSIFPFSRME